MSAAPAANKAEEETPKKGSKKLIIIVVAAVVVVLLLAAGAAFFLMKKNAAHAEGEEGDTAAAVAESDHKDKAAQKDATPPVFVPLEPFVVNLADRESERFVQIGINLQVSDAKVGDSIKLYMPAIRNAVLLILSRKTASDLLTADGKIMLAEEIQRGAARAMGYDIPEPEPQEVADGEEEERPVKKKRKKKAEVDNPIVQVHYASFIIQ